MKNLKIGLFGARADNTGLGQQTYEFYRNMRPAKTLLVDISSMTGKPSYNEKYLLNPIGDVKLVSRFPDNFQVDEFLQDLDVIFCCEIPYNYGLFTSAWSMGIKTILQYNWEFLDYLRDPGLPKPTVLASPSSWFIEEARARYGNVAYLPTPVNRDNIPYRRREGKTFVHIAGGLLHEDRNGTEIVRQAIKQVLDPHARFIIYAQRDLPGDWDDPRVELRCNDVPNYQDLYADGDILLLPRRYGGQSLQVNEAQAAGMVVVMPNCSPNWEMVHPKCLVSVNRVTTTKTRCEIPVNHVHPSVLAQKIDELTKEDIGALSDWSNDRANQISWETWKPKYEAYFEEVCGG